VRRVSRGQCARDIPYRHVLIGVVRARQSGGRLIVALDERPRRARCVEEELTLVDDGSTGGGRCNDEWRRIDGRGFGRRRRWFLRRFRRRPRGARRFFPAAALHFETASGADQRNQYQTANKALESHRQVDYRV